MEAEQSLIGSVLFRTTAGKFDNVTGLWNFWRPKLTGVPQDDVAAGERYAREVVEVMRTLNMPHLLNQVIVDCFAAHAVMVNNQADWFACGFFCMLGQILVAGKSCSPE